MRIAEDLMSEIRQRAAAEHLSINRMINRLLKAGLRSSLGKEKPFKETVHDMGQAKVDVTKALALSAALDDEEFIRRMNLTK